MRLKMVRILMFTSLMPIGMTALASNDRGTGGPGDRHPDHSSGRDHDRGPRDGPSRADPNDRPQVREPRDPWSRAGDSLGVSRSLKDWLDGRGLSGPVGGGGTGRDGGSRGDTRPRAASPSFGVSEKLADWRASQGLSGPRLGGATDRPSLGIDLHLTVPSRLELELAAHEAVKKDALNAEIRAGSNLVLAEWDLILSGWKGLEPWVKAWDQVKDFAKAYDAASQAYGTVRHAGRSTFDLTHPGGTLPQSGSSKYSSFDQGRRDHPTPTHIDRTSQAGQSAFDNPLP